MIFELEENHKLFYAFRVLAGKMKRFQNSFLYKNSLCLVLLTLAAICIVFQSITGYHEYEEFLQEEALPSITYSQYFITGHFIQSTFENWESEFLQMALFVWQTVFLRQIGSAESKKLDGSNKVDRQPKNKANAPWPVKKGGLILSLYKHSLSLSLFLLFVVSFLLHWYGSCADYNLQQQLKGKESTDMIHYLSNSRMWFESFQNWQVNF